MSLPAFLRSIRAIVAGVEQWQHESGESLPARFQVLQELYDRPGQGGRSTRFEQESSRLEGFEREPREGALKRPAARRWPGSPKSMRDSQMQQHEAVARELQQACAHCSALLTPTPTTSQSALTTTYNVPKSVGVVALLLPASLYASIRSYSYPSP